MEELLGGWILVNTEGCRGQGRGKKGRGRERGGGRGNGDGINGKT